MKLAFITTALTFLASTSLGAECLDGNHVTKEEVLAAQQAWAEGIVEIGKAKNPNENALELIESLYAYNLGDVLFKPTLASVDQFRGTKDEALSYFVGGGLKEDQGFALRPFTKIRFENEDILLSCNSALAMGNYYFTTQQGEEIKVEYSMGYTEDENGKLRINLHHSSLPYQG